MEKKSALFVQTQVGLLSKSLQTNNAIFQIIRKTEK